MRLISAPEQYPIEIQKLEAFLLDAENYITKKTEELIQTEKEYKKALSDKEEYQFQNKKTIEDFNHQVQILNEKETEIRSKRQVLDQEIETQRAAIRVIESEKNKLSEDCSKIALYFRILKEFLVMANEELERDHTVVDFLKKKINFALSFEN